MVYEVPGLRPPIQKAFPCSDVVCIFNWLVLGENKSIRLYESCLLDMAPCGCYDTAPRAAPNAP